MTTSTTGVGTSQWLEVSKNLCIYTYMPLRVPNMNIESLELGKSKKEQLFTKADFECDLKKVSRKVKK